MLQCIAAAAQYNMQCPLHLHSPSSAGPSAPTSASLHISGGSVVKRFKFNLSDLRRVQKEMAGVMRSRWLTSSHSVVRAVSLLMLFGSLCGGY